jgi:hypothetical protein
MRDPQDRECLLAEANALHDVVREFSPSSDTRSPVEILTSARASLHKWRGRYAGSAHAKAAVHETNLIIEAIDVYLLGE